MLLKCWSVYYGCFWVSFRLRVLKEYSGTIILYLLWWECIVYRITVYSPLQHTRSSSCTFLLGSGFRSRQSGGNQRSAVRGPAFDQKPDRWSRRSPAKLPRRFPGKLSRQVEAKWEILLQSLRRVAHLTESRCYTVAPFTRICRVFSLKPTIACSLSRDGIPPTMGEINRGGHLNLVPKTRSGFFNLPAHPDTLG